VVYVGKFEQVGYRQFKLPSDLIQRPERGSVPTAFNQAQKIHGYANGLREFFLSHLAASANLAQPLPEFLP
jgi:hypothetical protein